jgi:hypothetical protein
MTLLLAADTVSAARHQSQTRRGAELDFCSVVEQRILIASPDRD